MIKEERDSFYPKEENWKIQIEMLQADVNKLRKEKEKLEKSKNSIENELNKVLDAAENNKTDPLKYVEEIQDFNNKIELLVGDKEILKKEKHLLQKDLENYKANVDKIINEKTNLQLKFQVLESEFSKFKETAEKESNNFFYNNLNIEKDLLESVKNSENKKVIEVEKEVVMKAVILTNILLF